MNNDLRLILINLTHISNRISHTLPSCSPEEIFEFLKYIRTLTTCHSNQCVCYLSHKVTTRVILQYPCLFALCKTINFTIQEIPTSPYHSGYTVCKRIYFLQTLQSLLETHPRNYVLTINVVSYLYSHRYSIVHSHRLRNSSVMNILETINLLSKALLRIVKQKEFILLLCKSSGNLPYKIQKICHTFIFSIHSAIISVTMDFPYTRIYWCVLIELLQKYLNTFAFKRRKKVESVTRFVISNHRIILSNLSMSILAINQTQTNRLTFRLHTQDYPHNIFTNMLLLYLDLLKYSLAYSLMSQESRNAMYNCSRLLEGISALITAAARYTESMYTDSSIFYLYNQEDKTLFKLISVLYELYSFLGCKCVVFEGKNVIYSTLPDPNSLFLTFLTNTGFDHVLLIDLLTSEGNHRFTSCLVTFLLNFLTCDGESVFKEIGSEFIFANDSDDSSDTANKFSDLVTELYLYFSKPTTNTKDTLLPLLIEITRKYRMLESIS